MSAAFPAQRATPSAAGGSDAKSAAVTGGGGSGSSVTYGVGGVVLPAPTSIGVNATLVSPKDKNVTLYVILVKWGSKVWTINRRFSEFEALYDKLAADLTKIPALPKKTFWGAMDPGVVAKRRHDLDLWLQVIVREPYVLNNVLFHTFIGTQDNVGAAALTKQHLPKEITHLEDSQFGVNALVYDDTNTVIFTACGDPNQLSRLDSKLSNMKMPWDKSTPGTAKAGTVVPIGSLSCWKEQQAIYKLACTLYFDSEVTCVAWDSARRYVFIGLDSGKMHVYFINEAFAEFNVVKTLSGMHLDRVVAIVYDKTKDVLISTSRDKRMLVFNAKNFELLSDTTVSKAWASCMALDSEHNRAFIGTYSQQILIFDLNTQPPSCSFVLSGHTGSLRCLTYSVAEKKCFSSGFDSVSGIWEVFPPSDVSRSHSVGWLTGGPAQKIKSITHYTAAGQVLTGLENGGICVWQTADGGKLLHVVPAHSDAVVSLEFIESKRMLISGSRDGKVKLWQFPSPDGKMGDVQPFTAAAAAPSAATASAASASSVGMKPATEVKQKPPLPPLPQPKAKPAATATAAAADDSNPFAAVATANGSESELSSTPTKPKSDPSAILHDLDAQ